LSFIKSTCAVAVSSLWHYQKLKKCERDQADDEPENLTLTKALANQRTNETANNYTEEPNEERFHKFTSLPNHTTSNVNASAPCIPRPRFAQLRTIDAVTAKSDSGRVLLRKRPKRFVLAKR
jgi:hypothetical protein